MYINKMQFCSAFVVTQTVNICLRVRKENNKNNWMSYFLCNSPKFKSVMKLRVSVREAHIWSTTGIRHPMKNAMQTCEKCRLLQTWHCFTFWMMFFFFIHNQNPIQAPAGTKSRMWNKKTKVYNLQRKTVDFGGGYRLHLIVVIAYRKGVVLKEVYEKMDGQFFMPFIWTHFNIAFPRSEPKKHGEWLFIVDNDPSQHTKVAKRALRTLKRNCTRYQHHHLI